MDDGKGITNIEKIFGGILLLAVIASGAFLVAKQGLPEFGGPSTATASVTEEVNPAIFSGNYKQDMCTCYELGFSRGQTFAKSNADNGASIDETPAFKIGYSACRAAAGLEGGSAWSDGWGKGTKNLKSQRKCSFYLKANNIR